MILTGSEIYKNVQAKTIIISPFDQKQINPNSYNYRLGTKIIKLSSCKNKSNSKINCTEPHPVVSKETILLKSSGYILLPGHLYLSSTKETIGSSKYVITLIGKSSMGRYGLFLQVSASLGHLGIAHKWTLEMVTRSPLKVYPNQIIGQICFWDIQGEELYYSGHYGQFSEPTANRNTK
jgi:dCTP deaminase